MNDPGPDIIDRVERLLKSARRLVNRLRFFGRRMWYELGRGAPCNVCGLPTSLVTKGGGTYRWCEACGVHLP